jgi:hypothetical protein
MRRRAPVLAFAHAYTSFGAGACPPAEARPVVRPSATTHANAIHPNEDSRIMTVVTYRLEIGKT